MAEMKPVNAAVEVCQERHEQPVHQNIADPRVDQRARHQRPCERGQCELPHNTRHHLASLGARPITHRKGSSYGQCFCIRTNVQAVPVLHDGASNRSRFRRHVGQAAVHDRCDGDLDQHADLELRAVTVMLLVGAPLQEAGEPLRMRCRLRWLPSATLPTNPFAVPPAVPNRRPNPCSECHGSLHALTAP